MGDPAWRAILFLILQRAPGRRDGASRWIPPVDVWDTENEIVYEFDLPGILEDKISIELEVVEGDITSLAVDAIANAANDRLWMGAGVAGAIKRAGGDDIEREAVALGPIEVGDAVATSAGRLRARYVIHGAVMGQDLRTNAGLIERTTRRCLEVADDLGLESIALPAFGTGVGGFPLDECARIMVAAVRAYEPSSLRRAVFAVFGADAKRAFDAALRPHSVT